MKTTQSLSKSLPGPMAAYEGAASRFWMLMPNGQWVSLTERALTRHLVELKYSPRRPPSGGISSVERELNRIQRENSVAYAGPIAGMAAGLHEVYGQRLLVTTSVAPIAAKVGEFPLLGGLFERMFCHGGIDQRPIFFGWLKSAIVSLRARIFRPGQALLLAGPPGNNKSTVQNLITTILGGRTAKASRYLQGRTEFSRDLVAAEHWVVEDDAEGLHPTSRAAFAARLKEAVANESFSLHAKGSDALCVRPLRRVTISLNSTAEALQALPPLVDGLRDKLILLLVAPGDLRTHEKECGGWEPLLQKIREELPAFIHFLENLQIAEEHHDSRYGVTSFHHPDLLATIGDLAPENRLLGLLDRFLVSSTQPVWRGTSEAVEATLREKCSDLTATLFSWPGACGTFLGRLAGSRPDRVRAARSADRREWCIGANLTP